MEPFGSGRYFRLRLNKRFFGIQIGMGGRGRGRSTTTLHLRQIPIPRTRRNKESADVVVINQEPRMLAGPAAISVPVEQLQQQQQNPTQSSTPPIKPGKPRTQIGAAAAKSRRVPRPRRQVNPDVEYRGYLLDIHPHSVLRSAAVAAAATAQAEAQVPPHDEEKLETHKPWFLKWLPCCCVCGVKDDGKLWINLRNNLLVQLVGVSSLRHLRIGKLHVITTKTCSN